MYPTILDVLTAVLLVITGIAIALLIVGAVFSLETLVSVMIAIGAFSVGGLVICGACALARAIIG